MFVEKHMMHSMEMSKRHKQKKHFNKNKNQTEESGILTSSNTKNKP